MIAFIGVRISWLVAARNALLAAFACSATSRASSASRNSRAFSIAIAACCDSPTRKFRSCFAERVTSPRAPDRHHPRHVAAGDERRGHQPLLGVLGSAGDHHRTRIRVRVVDDFGGAASGEVADHALAGGDRVGHDLLGRVAVDDDRREHPVRRFEEHRARVRLQELRRAQGDRPDHRVEVEHAADLATEVGEGGHLARASLRLTVQARVLDRGADVGGDRRQQPRVALAEPARFGDALHADHADRAALHEDRHTEVGVRRGADHLDAELAERLGAVEQERLALHDDP